MALLQVQAGLRLCKVCGVLATLRSGVKSWRQGYLTVLVGTQNLHSSWSMQLRRTWSSKPHLVTPLFLQMEEHNDKVALIDSHGNHTYDELLQSTYSLSKKILGLLKTQDSNLRLNDEKIAYLCPNDVSYIVTTLATWLSGGVAVPLCKAHPPGEWKYFIEDSASKLVVCTENYVEALKPVTDSLNIPLMILDQADFDGAAESDSEAETGPNQWKDVIHNLLWQLQRSNKFKRKPSLIVYTSGTTGRPKVNYVLACRTL